MARLFNAVEGNLILTIGHSIQNNDDAVTYTFDTLQRVDVSPNFINLLFEDFFKGDVGGKTTDGHTGKFTLKLLGKDDNNNAITKEITVDKIIITKYETETTYIFKLETDPSLGINATLNYNDKFYLQNVEYYYSAPINGTTSFTDPILLFSSDYPKNSTFAVDIPNTDPTEKGIYLDETISSIDVEFEYKITINK